MGEELEVLLDRASSAVSAGELDAATWGAVDRALLMAPLHIAEVPEGATASVRVGDHHTPLCTSADGYPLVLAFTAPPPDYSDLYSHPQFGSRTETFRSSGAELFAALALRGVYVVVNPTVERYTVEPFEVAELAFGLVTDEGSGARVFAESVALRRLGLSPAHESALRIATTTGVPDAVTVYPTEIEFANGYTRSALFFAGEVDERVFFTRIGDQLRSIGRDYGITDGDWPTGRMVSPEIQARLEMAVRPLARPHWAVARAIG